jgi:hypothetical protein
MTEFKMKHPLFPLAKPGAISALIVIAVLVAKYILGANKFADIWAGSGILPLFLYLGYCHFNARKMILAEQGREREIVEMGFVAMAADRMARVSSVLFGFVAVSIFTTTLAVWIYQAWIWHRNSNWSPLTWRSATGLIPLSSNEQLQRMYYWLGDTNLGVVILVVGLLIAVPIVAINSIYQHKAKLRRKDLINLKRRS